MVLENGVYWRPKEPEKRGKHNTFSSALQAAFNDLVTEHNDFFDSLVDSWIKVFPELPQIRPGRYADGTIYLYVRNAPTSFAMRPKLPLIKKRLSAMPGAPAKFNVRLEIHV